jgi:hypothetical protein
MDLFAEFMKLVVRLFVGISGLIGAGIQKITPSAIEGRTSLPAQTTSQKREEGQAPCRKPAQKLQIVPPRLLPGELPTRHRELPRTSHNLGQVRCGVPKN